MIKAAPTLPALVVKLERNHDSKQVGGSHYAKMLIPPRIYAWANDLDPDEFNVVKYVSRHRTKDGKKDLLKAKQYIDFLLEEYDG